MVRESKEMSEVKEQTKIFLGKVLSLYCLIAAGIVGVAVLMVLMAACFMLGKAAVVWLWNALGN